MRNMRLLEGAKRVLAIALTSSVLATLTPNSVGGVLKVEAAGPSNIGLGVSLITNPTGSGGWSKVNFGCYQRTVSGKITKYKLVWRVLSVSNTDLYLDCDNVIEAKRQYSDGDPKNYEWNDSRIRNWLNSDTGFNKSGNFTSEELSCIYNYNSQEQASTGYSNEDSVDMAVYNDKFFILGANDVKNVKYGYGDDASRKKYPIYEGGYYPGWWLRTRNKTKGTISYEGKNYTGIQFVGGTQQVNGSNYEGKFAPWANQTYDDFTGVSPACDINSRTILFTRAINDISYKEFALTLKDAGLSIGISNSTNLSRNGNTFTVPFSISGSKSTAATKPYVLVTDKEYTESDAKILYFDELNVTSSGIGTFTLADDQSDEFIYLIAQNTSSSVADTFYASEPVRLTNVHNWGVTVSGAKATITDNGVATSYTATIAASGKTYDGSAVEATVTKSTDFPVAATVGSITYKGISGTSYNSTTPPSNPGKYEASATVSFGGANADISTSFEITAAKEEEKAHTHTLKKFAAKAATATMAGNSEYYYCSGCDKYFSDSKGTKEIVKNSWVIAATGKTNDKAHTHKLVKTDAKDATTTAPGNTAFWTCTECGRFYSDSKGTKEIEKDSWVIPAKGSNNSGDNNGDNNNNNNSNNNTSTPVAKGKPVSNNSANFVVTSSDAKNPTVAYKTTKSSKATTITVPGSVKINGVTYKITEISKNAFKNNKNVKTVSIHKNVTKIGNYAFSGCASLTQVTGGAGVRTIGKGAFNNCKKLKKASMGSKVTTIGANAFYNCKKLTKTPLGVNVTSIGDKAFYNCESLTTLTFPAKTVKVGKQVAKGTKKLKTLTIKNKSLKSKNIGNGAFTGMGTKKTVVKVPKGKKSSYTKMFQSKGLNKSIKVQASK